MVRGFLQGKYGRVQQSSNTDLLKDREMGIAVSGTNK